jgi:hypothetical protein
MDMKNKKNNLNEPKNIFKTTPNLGNKNIGWLTDEYKKSKHFLESQEKLSIIISKFSEALKNSWSNGVD